MLRYAQIKYGAGIQATKLSGINFSLCYISVLPCVTTLTLPHQLINDLELTQCINLPRSCSMR